jgi:hypothetical protein
MLVIIGIIVLFVLTLWLGAYKNRKNKTENSEVEIKKINSECCGAHEICEKESLLDVGTKIIYFDDEELDALIDIHPQDFSEEQIEMLSDVFYTLNESDVAGWLCSLRTRRIQLPEDLKEEALMIVKERRNLSKP